MFVILTMALILGLGTLAMGGEKGVEMEVYYERVQIQKGDTLWEIAEKCKIQDANTEHMVEQIMEVNGMKNTNIRTGESIIVPIVVAA